MGKEPLHTMKDLQELQSYPLETKIFLTKQRIREWVRHYGEDGVYVSFSGGKDSTVLLKLVREEFKDIPAVFCDTGLEYPQIRDFVKTFDNVVWLKPKMTFRQVIETYGYPFISKEVSQKVYECRTTGARGKESYARRQFEGIYLSKNGKKSFPIVKWAFLLDAPFKLSHMCCNVMKKSPSKKYGKQSGRTAITGQMAEESRLRTQVWLRNGCNAYDAKNPISNPMSFWKENDVLQYIKQNNVEICSLYGGIRESGELDGQMTLDGCEQCMRLETTWLKRTGCVFCGFGCHLEPQGEGRFERLKVTHPHLYEYIMKPWEEGGLNYKEVIDWLNENGDLHIRY